MKGDEERAEVTRRELGGSHLRAHHGPPEVEVRARPLVLVPDGAVVPPADLGIQRPE